MSGKVMGAIALIATTALSAPAQARYVVTLTQQGSDVVATGTGTIDTGSFGALYVGNLEETPFAQSGAGTLLTGSPTSRLNVYYVSISGAPSFGSDLDVTEGAGSGDAVYINAGGALGVPVGYRSNTQLSSRANFAGQSLATLGLTPGTYDYAFGTGASADSFSVVIGNVLPAAAVPEPATWGMMILGFGAMGFAIRRRAKVRTAVGFA